MNTFRFILPALAVVLLQNAGVFSDETTDRHEAEQATLVIMAPAGPVLAELSISVDGQPYRLWVTTFLAQRVDLNKDGRLTIDELALIPERLLQQTTARNAKQALRKSAGNRSAQDVPVAEFAEWFSAQLSQSFNMIAGAVQPSEAVRLAALVDINGDGKVSRAELAVGGRTMRFRDLDDDQTFTAAELMPFRDPRNQQAAIVPDVANLPFVQLGDTQSVARTAAQILKRYGSGNGVPLKALRLPDDSPFNRTADSNDLVSDVGVQEILTSGVHHFRMDVQLSDRANQSRLVVEIPKATAEFCSATEERRGRYRLLLDEMPIEVRPRGGSRDSRGFLVNFLLQRMAIYDSDGNGYLSEDEFPELQQQMASQLQVAGEFTAVDLNGDGMLFRDEVKLFIERDAIATQSRIEVSVRQDGKTLFKLLDKNSDRRLTERELREGFDALLEFDIDHDEQLTESELGTAYTLEIGLGQAETMRMSSMQAMSIQARSTDAILPGVTGLDGPEWFRRMDRNQDRDVSYREFPGPRRTFEQLDANADGLISAKEAEQFDE
ncbi:MAG: hypothetical protein R3C59_13725 [Planctomycetaceae bacterium]